MNKIITSLAFIADAAVATRLDYKLTWAMRGSLVWAANALITAREREDTPEQIAQTEAKLDTLRVIAADFAVAFPFSTSSTFAISHRDVENHLGLAREPDLHEEAKRIAKSRALRTRQLGKLKEFYDAALTQVEEQRRVRRDRLEEIVELCNTYNTERGDDYDEALVERELESLEGKVAEVCEGILGECEAQLARHMIPHVVRKWEGYRKGALTMLDLLGVSETQVLAARSKFDAMLKAETDKLDAPVKGMDAALDAMKPEAPAPVKRLSAVELAALNHAKTVAHMERCFNDTKDAFESGSIGRAQAIAELKSIGRTGTEVRKWKNPNAKVVKGLKDIGDLTAPTVDEFIDVLRTHRESTAQ